MRVTFFVNDRREPGAEQTTTLLISADDCALAEQTSREAAQAIHPEVPWRGGREFDEEPHRTLVDNRAAKALLGWQPRIRFM